MYHLELVYGYVEDDDCGIYHAFEALDPNSKDTDYEEVAKELAEMLDTTPDDSCFNWDVMDIALPDSLVKAIQADAVNPKE